MSDRLSEIEERLQRVEDAVRALAHAPAAGVHPGEPAGPAAALVSTDVRLDGTALLTMSGRTVMVLGGAYAAARPDRIRPAARHGGRRAGHRLRLVLARRRRSRERPAAAERILPWPGGHPHRAPAPVGSLGALRAPLGAVERNRPGGVGRRRAGRRRPPAAAAARRGHGAGLDCRLGRVHRAHPRTTAVRAGSHPLGRRHIVGRRVARMVVDPVAGGHRGRSRPGRPDPAGDDADPVGPAQPA